MKTGLPLDREAFTTYIASVLAQEPDIEVLARDTLSLKLRSPGFDGQISLSDSYAQYLRAPKALNKLVDVFISQVRFAVQSNWMPDLDKVADQLYPQLKPLASSEAVYAQGVPSLLSHPFAAGLMITYVIDRPDSMSLITVRHTEKWQVDEQVLYQIAMPNLARRKFEYGVSEKPRHFFACHSLDGYDATRILLSAMLDEWDPGFCLHRLLLGLPNRDCLIGFSDADPNTVAAIAAQVHRDAASCPYSLTDRLLIWENGTLRQYPL